MPWPDWKVGDLPSLARYVSMPALDETGLPVPDRFTEAGPAGANGRAVVRSIYESILGLGLKYMHEPWRVKTFGFQEFEPMQRVRYPAWVRRDSGGTCLDIAILFATALMRAQIRPYIAILYPAELADPGRGQAEGHAFVIADLLAPLTEQHWDPTDPAHWSSPPLRRARAAGHPGRPEIAVLSAGRGPDPGYYKLSAEPGSGQRPGRRLRAGRDCGRRIPDQLGRKTVRRRDRAAQGSSRAWSRSRRRDPGDLDAVAGDAWGDGYPAGSMPTIGWRRRADGSSCTSPPGFGKSMLACDRARSADGGYGWLLNAIDRSTLQSQLAQAENDQRARGYRQPLDALDQEPFSELAVRRLEVSEAPWVLVLDNADGKPGDITPILPRDVGPNQTIIVTTTNPDWLKEWPESGPGQPATHVVLAALESEDMPGIDQGARDLVAAARSSTRRCELPSRPVPTSRRLRPAALDSSGSWPGITWLAGRTHLTSRT